MIKSVVWGVQQNRYRLSLVLVLSFLLTFAITACGLGGGDLPDDHYYRLPDISVTKQAQAAFDEIVIKPVKASGLYHDRAILYIEKEKPLELQRYHYYFWAETPANLLQNALYQGLLSSGVSGQVSRQLGEHRADYIIDSRIIRFERVIDGSNVTVEVVVEIALRSGKNATQHWSRRYASTQQLQTTAMHDSAEAFARALQQIVETLIGDLNKQ